MFTFIFQWKSFHLFPPPVVKIFFEKFSPRFLYSKKMDFIIFFNSESSSRLIPDIFYFLWEVFLIDFLSKMEAQKAWNSFGMILNWWNFGLPWIKFSKLPLSGDSKITIWQYMPITCWIKRLNDTSAWIVGLNAFFIDVWF